MSYLRIATHPRIFAAPLSLTPVEALARLRGAQRAAGGPRGGVLLALTRDRLPADPPRDVACRPAYRWMLAETGAN